MKMSLPKHTDKILLVAIFTTFMGQIYIRPFSSDFRLTIAVIVLNILMLTFRSIPAVPTINLVGLFMLIIRSALYAFNNQVPISNAFMIYYPIIFFYIFYSIFFVLLDIRKQINAPLSLFLGLWICDTIPNVIEVLVRNEWQYSNFESVVLTIITIGLIRTIFTILLVYFSISYYKYLHKKQDYQKFIERVILLSNLKTELFFLRKSKKDIEDAMEKSYMIYERLEMPENKEYMLNVAKDIHEIKKDYTRVIAGIEKSIQETSYYEMKYSEMIKIIFTTQELTILNQDKRIKLQHHMSTDFQTSAFYVLISILNNLIINSIDAIKHEGRITITQKINFNTVEINVHDNGEGINTDDLKLIFNPGYSTKYNIVSGIMSSGIGLTHVKYLVEEVLNGQIEITSSQEKGTCFKLNLPLENFNNPTEQTKPISTTEGVLI